MTDFDEKAAHWDDDPLKSERARRVAEAIRALVPLQHDWRALEYGCGTGLLSFALRAEFASITLADTSQGMIEVLARKIEAAHAENMFPTLIGSSRKTLAGSSFNIVYSLMALHHIPDTAASLRKFHDLLTPGGWLCIADLDKEDGSFHGEGVKDVHKGFDRAELQTQAERAGFSGVKFSTVFTVQKENEEFPVFLMIASR